MIDTADLSCQERSSRRLKMKMYRQGDVLIVEATAYKTMRSVVVQPDNVLVHGELTGHAHRAVGDEVTVLESDEQKFVSAPKGFSLTHDEHDTIEIPEGFYRVVRQREYDEEEIRYVRD
jgi:hypothetical protein